MGHNFLYLLEAAKKNVLQPGCAVVPCAASLYAMGINIETQTVGEYDLSGLNKYRSAKQAMLQAHISTPNPVMYCVHAYVRFFVGWIVCFCVHSLTHSHKTCVYSYIYMCMPRHLSH